MPDYIQDPNDSKKQIPGPPPDNYFDKLITTGPHSMSKTPNYVLVTANLSNTAAFFFGSSASFASKESGLHVTGSEFYQTWGGEASLLRNDKLNIHPLAWSGSATDAGKIMFVYKGGLDGSGRP
tara:strand:+ start:53 stop:424 length:372 start_codon:yes stop_codon:yes gene_type:complete